MLRLGTRLSLLGRSEDGGWLLTCCVDGQQVWLAQFLIQPDVPIDTLPIQPAPTGLRPTERPIAIARRETTTAPGDSS